MSDQPDLFGAVDALLQEATVELPAPAERRRLREGAGISRSRLAQALDVSPSTAAAWETDPPAGRDPSGQTRVAYARLLEGLARRAVPDSPTPAPAAAAQPTPPPAAPVEEEAVPQESPVARQARTAHQRHHARKRTTSAEQARSELGERIAATVDAALTQAGGDQDAATDALIKRAIPDVMALFAATRRTARYEHTAYPRLPDIFAKPSKSDPDLIWEARPSWRHPGLRRSPDGPLTVTALDVNAAYLSALKTHLPIGRLEHSTTGVHDRKRAGVHLITPPTWNHPHLPSPLGDRQERGPVWITEPTLRLLLRLAGPTHQLLDAPVIHESWTSGSTEGMLDALRQLLAETRTNALEAGDDVTAAYVKAMYSKFVSTLGESVHNREIVRPDWVHLIRSQAFANLWGRAYKAHQAGLTVASVLGTDELHLVGDWRQVFTEGRGLADMKIKDDREGRPVSYTATEVNR